MKKVKLLMVFAATGMMVFSCKKNVEVATSADDHCSECNTEHYESPFGSVGEIRKATFDGREITYTRIDGLNIMEGDVILTNAQVGLDEDGNPMRGTITTTSSKIWPSDKVYYKFASGLPQATIDKFNTAKAHWESKTNIRFHLRTTQANYLNVVSGTGCSSYIGMIGGAQNLTLASTCSSGNAIHEIGHAIGLWHEHTRTSRNSYITVNYGNITAGKEGNFNICTNCTSNSTLDFGSIMMYDSYAFSKNGLPTIVKLNGTTFTSQRNALSANDIAIVATKY